MQAQPLQKKANRTLFFVAIGVFLVVSVLTGVRDYQLSRIKYSTTMRARIDVARKLTQNALFHTDAMVQSIIQSHSDNLDELLLQLAASRYFEFHGDSFYVLNRDGRVLLISEPYNEYKGLDFSTMISKKPVPKRRVQHYRQSLLTKRSVITIQYPLKNGYLLVVERSLANIIPALASFEDGKLFEDELFFVLSTTGQTIYHPDRSLMATRHNLGFDLKNITRPNKTGLFSFSYQDQKYIALSEQFTEPDNWIIYYCIPEVVANKVIKKNIVNQLIFLLLLFLLLFFILQRFFNNFFASPINKIVNALEHSEKETQLPLSSSMSGNILEFSAIIAAIKARDKEITKTAIRFQTVLDSLNAAVYVADMKTYELIFVNKYAKEIYGDAIGQKCYLSVQHNQNAPCDFCTNHLLTSANGTPADVHIWEFQNTVTGQWFECRDRAIQWTDGRIVRIQIATNISKRKNFEKALQSEKERLNVTLRSIGDGVITTDIKGKVVFLNKVAEELSGWTNKEAKDKPSTKVFNIFNEKTGLKCVSPVQRVIELGRIIGLANHTALIAKDGTVRSIADSGAPIRDKDSNVIGVVLVFRDVTHERKVEEELLKTRKLESIGVLAGGIAHDFNNILSAILGNIELAGFRLQKTDPKTAFLLSGAEKATKRAAKLTDQLLTFSKGGEPIKEITSLPDFIRESAEFILHGGQIVCNYIFQKHLWMVDVDSGQLDQVIQNIIINAKHAMPEGGTITIKCNNVEDAAVETLLSVDQGNYVCITIQDTGVGIPKEIISKIFDPYFTTKQEGSGLGLAICHSIINKHDGYLTVHSTIGKGTEFTLFLPAAQSHTGEESVTKETKNGSAIKAARIMIMDDEEILRDVAKSQLSVLGHETILVINGTQAINKYQELQDSGTPVDVVIMDLTIPGGMGGQEAAKKLLLIDPDARIIVSSGYSNDPVMANYREYGFRAAVAKPFDLKQLNNAIINSLN